MSEAIATQLYVSLILAAVLSVPLSLGLLAAYRRVVTGWMAETRGGPDSALPTSEVLRTTPPAPVSPVELRSELSVGPWRSAGVYLLAGLAYAIVMAFGYGGSTVGPSGLTFLTWTFLWPAVPALLLVAPALRQARGALLGFYAPAWIALAAFSAARNPEVSFSDLLGFALILNGLGTAIVPIFLWHRIRAVGMSTLSFMALALTGAIVVTTAVGESDSALEGFVAIGYAIGLGAAGVFLMILVFGFLLFALPGAVALVGIRTAYVTRFISDQSYLVDSIWFFFAVAHACGLAFTDEVDPILALGAFVAYRVVSMGGFRLVARLAPDRDSPRLLMLRVFELDDRSQALAEAVERHWRHAGPTQLICGPDRATSTVEPDEFLAFLTGGLRDRFIHRVRDVPARVAEIDDARDLDGRYRTTELFCTEDVWRAALTALLGSSDVVLMDLRSFDRGNSGCIHELRELAQRSAHERIVLVVDEETDRELLDQTLREAARAVGREGEVAPHTVEIEDPADGEELERLLRALCLAAAGEARA